jgi:tetratricopeptide (TPR) repeat protein
MECLNERVSSVRALIDVLAAGDQSVVDKAVSAVGALPTLEPCADVAMLRAVLRPPDDPAKRAEVARLREDVAKVNALASAGRCEQSNKLGRPVQEATAKLGYKPLEAEITYALGRLGDCCFDTKQALTDLEDAAMMAEAARHDEIAIAASVYLAGAYADRTHDARMGRHWIRHGAAISARFPGHPELEARIALTQGVVLAAEGRFEEAVREGRRAMAIQEPLFGPTSPEVGESVNNIAVHLHELGRDDEAQATIRRAHAILAKIFGEESGRVAFSYLNEAEILTGLGRFQDARTAIARSRETLEREGASPYITGYLLLDEGKIDLAEGNVRAAARVLERALPLLGTQDLRWTAEARFALGRALWSSSPADRKRAMELVRSAAETTVDIPSAAGLAREIAAWEQAHAPLRK